MPGQTKVERVKEEFGCYFHYPDGILPPHVLRLPGNERLAAKLLPQAGAVDPGRQVAANMMVDASSSNSNQQTSPATAEVM
jgi:hypothetical protein